MLILILKVTKIQHNFNETLVLTSTIRLTKLRKIIASIAHAAVIVLRTGQRYLQHRATPDYSVALALPNSVSIPLLRHHFLLLTDPDVTARLPPPLPLPIKTRR